MNARILAGTSGYSYPEWKGSFYPEKLSPAKFLEFYAGQLPTVEINNTFYRFPAPKLLEGWQETTPDEFRFAVKANQRITHRQRLKDVSEVTQDFVDRCRLLGPKLGPILFQLPPFLRRDDDKLAGFLDALPPGGRYALEFRHESWFSDDVWTALTEAAVALVVSEGEKLETPRVATADFTYVRLRKDGYDDDALNDWHLWFNEQRTAGREVWVYLKHDEKGTSPEHALRLLREGK